MKRQPIVFVDLNEAAASFDRLAKQMGLPFTARSPQRETVTEADLTSAARIVAPLDHRDSLIEQFPAIAAKLDVWLGSSSVEDFVARLLGGGGEPPPAPGALVPAVTQKPATVKVGRETAGRRGKGVTTVWEVPLDDAGLRELAQTLKQRCGTGGTVKEGRIEIQGDHRDRVAAELERIGYKVKRVGG